MNDSDVFLLTSLWEGLPIALLEAMYYKKVCIVSNCIGNRDVIINGQIVKNLDGIVKGVHPGKPIMSYFVDKTIHNEAIDFKLRSNDGIDISIDNIYEIEDTIYLPIKEVFKELNIPIEINKNGLIHVNKILQLSLGSKDATLRGESLKLSYEPIIYKSDVYMALDDFSLVLQEDYEISKSDNLLDLKSLAKKDKPKNSISNPPNNKDQSKGKTNSIALSVIVSIFSGTLMLAIFFRLKNKK